MGTTNLYGWPYPEPTDPVRNGAANIRALAEAISNSLFNSVGSLGFKAGSSVVQVDANGTAIIPFDTPFKTTLNGLGCIPVGMNGDAAGGIQFIVGSYAPQAFISQWTVVLHKLDGSNYPTATPARVNWVAAGVV